MPPAVIAGVGAAATIGGAVLSSKAQKKAAKTASNAEVSMARENNALVREFRTANEANFQPWMQSGARANSLVDSFLYGPAPSSYYPQEQAQQAPQPAPMNIMEESSGLRQMLPYWKAPDGAEPQMNALLPSSQPAPGQVTTTQAQPALQQPSGYQAFVNSPYYQFPLQEGYRGLNHNYAARGMLESGDAMKAITRYGQDYGYGRMGEFIGLAERQSDRGVDSAAAIAGVGRNALGAQMGNNNAIAASQAARAIGTGYANANMYSGIGSALANFAGSVAGPRSSYNSQYGYYPTSGAIGM